MHQKLTLILRAKNSSRGFYKQDERSSRAIILALSEKFPLGGGTEKIYSRTYSKFVTKSEELECQREEAEEGNKFTVREHVILCLKSRLPESELEFILLYG